MVGAVQTRSLDPEGLRVDGLATEAACARVSEVERVLLERGCVRPAVVVQSISDIGDDVGALLAGVEASRRTLAAVAGTTRHSLAEFLTGLAALDGSFSDAALGRAP